MNELYILEFTYDVIFGQSYKLVPMKPTELRTNDIIVNARTLGNMKNMQRTNIGKRR